MEQWLPDVDRRRDVQCPLPSPRAACAARHRIHRSHREHHRRRPRALALLVRSPGCPAKPPPPPPGYRLTPPPVPASPTRVRLPTPNWWPTASTAPARLSTSRTLLNLTVGRHAGGSECRSRQSGRCLPCGRPVRELAVELERHPVRAPIAHTGRRTS